MDAKKDKTAISLMKMYMSSVKYAFITPNLMLALMQCPFILFSIYFYSAPPCRECRWEWCTIWICRRVNLRPIIPTFMPRVCTSSAAPVTPFFTPASPPTTSLGHHSNAIKIEHPASSKYRQLVVHTFVRCQGLHSGIKWWYCGWNSRIYTFLYSLLQREDKLVYTMYVH